MSLKSEKCTFTALKGISKQLLKKEIQNVSCQKVVTCKIISNKEMVLAAFKLSKCRFN